MVFVIAVCSSNKKHGWLSKKQDYWQNRKIYFSHFFFNLQRIFIWTNKRNSRSVFNSVGCKWNLYGAKSLFMELVKFICLSLVVLAGFFFYEISQTHYGFFYLKHCISWCFRLFPLRTHVLNTSFPASGCFIYFFIRTKTNENNWQKII